MARRSKAGKVHFLWHSLAPAATLSLLADISVRFTCTICRSGPESEVWAAIAASEGADQGLKPR